MTSRELVRKTLAFESPARFARQTWILPWAEEHHPDEVRRLRADFPDDIVASPALYREPVPVVGDRYRKGVYIDEWGCRFDNIHGGVIGLVREPRIRDWNDLDGFETPEGVVHLDAERINAFCRETGRFVLAGTLVRPFERLCFLRTMEQALVDVLKQPAGFTELMARLHAHYLREVEAWSKTDVDAIALMDDWGTQTAMMVSPVQFRKLFKPLYRDYAEVAHRHGKAVFMHSDGCITDIIGDLIEVGVDALNSQVKCMGVEELGRRFRGRLTFWGEIDRQELLPFGTREQVREAVRAMHEHLWAGGGVIAQCEFGPGARPENIRTVFEAWKELEHWRKP